MHALLMRLENKEGASVLASWCACVFVRMGTGMGVHVHFIRSIVQCKQVSQQDWI